MSSSIDNSRNVRQLYVLMSSRSGASILVVVSALAGLVFASVSTSDFAEHLDRQVHSIHCSFVPGLGAEDVSGTSGCHVTMMSPYSSVFRKSIWGGIPVSLPAMGIFAFLLFWAGYLIISKHERDRNATLVLLVVSIIPVLASVIMGYLAFAKLDATCKLCIGIYAASVGSFVGAWLLHRNARKSVAFGADDTQPDNTRFASSIDSSSKPAWITPAVMLALFVAVPTAVYAMSTPDVSNYVTGCGRLERTNDVYGIMVPVGSSNQGVDAIEVLDPLCPACKAFEERLRASDLESQLKRKGLLFPLDNQCNWMVSSAVHPGACAVSEAVLCAESQADIVLQWAFEHQEEIRTAAARDPKAAANLVGAQFPQVRSCLGSAAVKAKLNRSLRWAVSNNLAVLTPQLYVDGVKLCDEDTDLGLDYALSRLLQARGAAR